jgi:GNAT superfamily N-acetyltransferase
MPSIEVRPFRRADRQQLAGLVNAHIEAVVPGWSVSVNAVLSQFEREPDEAIVDPWVVQRAAYVAIERDMVVAGALLLRYADQARVSDSYRDAGEIRWLVCRPGSADAGDALARACVGQLGSWGVARQYADGALPAPTAVYGIPDCWPHVRGILERAGFACTGRTEIVMVADVADLPSRDAPPMEGLTVRRTLGGDATRLAAILGGEQIGAIEVRTDLTGGGLLSRAAGWGDVWDLQVGEPYRRRGVGTWLMGEAAGWLALGRVERLLGETYPEREASRAFLAATGWRELVRTERGWVRGE